jgi:hypothetical protein
MYEIFANGVFIQNAESIEEAEGLVSIFRNEDAVNSEKWDYEIRENFENEFFGYSWNPSDLSSCESVIRKMRNAGFSLDDISVLNFGGVDVCVIFNEL